MVSALARSRQSIIPSAGFFEKGVKCATRYDLFAGFYIFVVLIFG
jgi:hypothetical protein